MSFPSENEESPKERPSALDVLENRLYSRTPPPVRHDEEFIGEEKHIRIAPGWTEEAERKESAVYSIGAAIMPWLKRFLIASIIFFLFAAAVSLYGFWRGGNTVSPQNISIDVQGPVGAGAGEEVSLEVTIGNDNPLDLSSVDLLVEYPEGTRKPDNLSEPLLRYRDSLGSLAAKERAARTLTFVPFGEEGERKTVAITAEYRPQDSNAIFSRVARYEFQISSAPVTLTTDMPKEVNADQTFEIALTLNSNSAGVQENLLVKAEYPFGFQFEDSEPAPAFGKDTWHIGDIEPQGKRTVRIRGKMQAAAEEERTFRFSVGAQNARDEKRIGTVFLAESSTVAIRKAFINLDIVMNGEKGKTFIGRSGQSIRGDVVWGNNLSAKIADLEIVATLRGDIYNRASVSAGNGFYDSNDGTIVWDKRKSARFAVVEPGENGTQSFSITLLPVSTDPAEFRHPEMTIEVVARGKRLDEQGLYQQVISSVTKEVKISSTLSLASRLLHSDGTLVNAGPLPPKAEEETTYTVVWSLSNTSNGVADVRVSAILPSYARWLGETDPTSEELLYAPVGGELVWNVGEIEAGTGVGTPPREVSFKVGFTPSLSQVNTAPALIGETVARGRDLFTGVAVTSNIRTPLTTASLSDAGAGTQSGKVAP